MLFNREYLYKSFQKKYEFWRFLVGQKLLVGERKCLKCKKNMKLKEAKCSDGFIWRCNTYKCKKTEISIRKNSCFWGIKASLKEIIMIIYEWSINTPIKTIKKEIKCDYQLINRVLWIIRRKLESLKVEKIGGENKIVEVDETAVTKRKFHKGRKVGNLWCVGGIERDTKESFFSITEKRNQEMLVKILKDNIAPGSIIITDEWRGYLNISKFEYIHKTVCHKTNFIDTKDSTIHTQTIEATWRWLKCYIKLYSSNIRKNLKWYILEYKFKKKSKNVFHDILNILKHDSRIK
ncbi:hypothetical protein DMUE_6128 [Dictyocoela muelleri]|nr:hypothetical protein DMUE_6128 [Dictyocoela muelleri]